MSRCATSVRQVFTSPLSNFVLVAVCVFCVLGFRAQGEEETFAGVDGKAEEAPRVLLIWAEVRWCSAAWGGRSEQSCWRGGSCSLPASWAPGRPGR